MIDWTARAKERFSQKAQTGTVKTDETPVLSVSSVRPQGIVKNTHGVSSVSSVGVVALFENRVLAADLMDAAMRACDHHGDDETAREEMRQDVLNTPDHLRADLLAHLNATYPPRSKA